MFAPGTPGMVFVATSLQGAFGASGTTCGAGVAPLATSAGAGVAFFVSRRTTAAGGSGALRALAWAVWTSESSLLG